mmetsp:Transcript_33812/g.84861  ORF Transcript_33812/g.84861 Transcript_33812/m.84861 type:complete len:228 (+) Transcript_33812:1724-2407(+)
MHTRARAPPRRMKHQDPPGTEAAHPLGQCRGDQPIGGPCPPAVLLSLAALRAEEHGAQLRPPAVGDASPAWRSRKPPQLHCATPRRPRSRALRHGPRRRRSCAVPTALLEDRGRTRAAEAQSPGVRVLCPVAPGVHLVRPARRVPPLGHSRLLEGHRHLRHRNLLQQLPPWSRGVSACDPRRACRVRDTHTPRRGQQELDGALRQHAMATGCPSAAQGHPNSEDRWP